MFKLFLDGGVWAGSRMVSLWWPGLLALILAAPFRQAVAAPVAWSAFDSAPGFIVPYTAGGQTIHDWETTKDPSGDPAVKELDISSGSPGVANFAEFPGPYSSALYGYYPGTTRYDPLTPPTANDDYILFRIRVDANPMDSATTFKGQHWNAILDTDDDGYKEFWVDLDGNDDTLKVFYSNRASQSIDPVTDRIAQFSVDPAAGYTRVTAVTDGTGEYLIDIQLPVSVFDDTRGNQVLYPDSPVGFVFTTGRSANNPIQNDWMMPIDPNGGSLDLTDPILFGDITRADGEGIVNFVDGNGVQVSFYRAGDPVFISLRHPAANTTVGNDTVTVSVSNPANGDSEQRVLRETGPNTGVFTNRGGASQPTTYGTKAAIVGGVTTSGTTGAETWTLTYRSATKDWRVAGSTSGVQAAAATAAAPFTASGGQVSFTLFEYAALKNSDNGATITFNTLGAAPLATSTSAGAPNDGVLQVADGNRINVTYSPASGVQPRDEADIVDPSRPYIQFTRSTGIPNDLFYLTPFVSESDLIYVTVSDPLAGTNPTLRETVSVTIRDKAGGGDLETIVLTETGINTHVFRNGGLAAQLLPANGIPVAPGVWEGRDSQLIVGSYTRGAGSWDSGDGSLFTGGGGRVYFSNSTGTQNVDMLGNGERVYVEVWDFNADTNPATLQSLTVTLASGPPGGVDQETLTLTETTVNSGVFRAAVPSGVVAQLLSGGVAPGDGVLEALNGAALTATYQDVDDGDLDPGNNAKMDVAVFNAPPVFISSVYFEPTPTETEMVEITNGSTSSVNVTGYRVSDEDAPGLSFLIPKWSGSQDIVLAPGEKLRVYLRHNTSQPTKVGAVYNVTASGYTEPSTVLDRQDQISLYDATGTIVDFVAWSDTPALSADFESDDYPAVNVPLWTDNAYVNVAAITSGKALYRSPPNVDTNRIADWILSGTTLPPPTYALISDVRAVWSKGEGKVYVEWDTASEAGTVGFYLETIDSATGSWRRVNEELLPGLMMAPRGGRYAYEDREARLGDRRMYRLIELEATGDERTYGPYEVVVGAGKPSVASGREVLAEDGAFEGGMGSFKRERISAGRAQGLRIRAAKAERNGARSVRAQAGQAAAVKIGVREAGLYRVSVSALVAGFGLTGKEVKRRLSMGGFRLEVGGTEVPYWSQGTGLIFYGEALRGTYTDNNVYRLTQRKRTLDGASARGGQLEHGGAADWFESIASAEEDKILRFQSFEPRADQYLWGFALAGSGAASFPVATPDAAVAATGQARVRVWMRSLITARSGFGEHRVQIAVNGSSAGPEMMWDGIRHVLYEGVVSASALSGGGENLVSVLAPKVAGMPANVIGVDRIEIDYPRRYRALSDRLIFANRGYRGITVQGLSGATPFLLDVTLPSRPYLVEASTALQGDGSFALSFTPASAASRYALAGPNGWLSPVFVEPDQESSWKTARHELDYIVIAPKSLEAGAKALAEYRSGEYRTGVVLLEDIYDEFNRGIVDARAIRDFLAYAYENWQSPPAYVVLMGRGTYDHRDVQGKGNLFPVWLTATADGVFACDLCYADVAGDDGMPEYRLGRIPVLSNSEAERYLEKLKAYEAADPIGWADRVLFVGDNADKGGFFADDAMRAMASVRGPFKPELMAHGVAPFVGGATRTELLSRLAAGVGMLNYTGHGSVTGLGSELFLWWKDVAPLDVAGERETDWLKNGSRLPIFVALTCLVGNSQLPDYVSLTEALLNHPGGGAIAGVAATGYSDSKEAAVLNEALVRALYGERPVATLGEGFSAGLEALVIRGGGGSLARVYSLSGDPALRLH